MYIFIRGTPLKEIPLIKIYLSPVPSRNLSPVPAGTSPRFLPELPQILDFLVKQPSLGEFKLYD
jgi:hypothetical protein